MKTCIASGCKEPAERGKVFCMAHCYGLTLKEKLEALTLAKHKGA